MLRRGFEAQHHCPAQGRGRWQRDKQPGYNEISIAAGLSRSLFAGRAAQPFVQPDALDDQPTYLSRQRLLTMSIRSLCAALMVVLACLSATAARADQLADIEALHNEGKTDQALQQADAAIALQPRDAAIRFQKAVMLTDLGRQAEAIEVYLALTQDFPELADPYNNLAVLYAASGQWNAALVALQTALRNDPKHLRARENLGDVYLALAVQAWTAAEVQSKGEDAKLLHKLKQAEAIGPTSVRQGNSRRR